MLTFLRARTYSCIHIPGGSITVACPEYAYVPSILIGPDENLNDLFMQI